MCGEGMWFRGVASLAMKPCPRDTLGHHVQKGRPTVGGGAVNDT